MQTLIGGVGYRWQRDASFGVVAADALAAMAWPPDVAVEDLGYGALLVALDLSDAAPPYDRLILISGVARGRKPGSLHRYPYREPLPADEEVQARVCEAGGGVIALDHLLIIAHRLGALPAQVEVIEFEPLDSSPGIELTPAGQAALAGLIAGLAMELAAGRAESRAPSLEAPARRSAST